MSWTYDSTVGSAVDRVRLLIGDTDSTDQQLQDEEIQFFLDQDSNVHRVAATCCRVLAAKYARQVDKQVGDLKIAASQRHKQYLLMLEDLSVSASRVGGVPMAGGVYAGDKSSMESRDDVVKPSIRIGIHDF